MTAVILVIVFAAAGGALTLSTFRQGSLRAARRRRRIRKEADKRWDDRFRQRRF